MILYIACDYCWGCIKGNGVDGFHRLLFMSLLEGVVLLALFAVMSKFGHHEHDRVCMSLYP